MPKPGLAARRAALDLVTGVTGEGRALDETEIVGELPPEDRARALRLASETLRWSDRADRMLGPHLRKRPPDAVLNLLRLGVVDLCVGRAAPHGVVDVAVAIAKRDRTTARQAGLVNAVLRKIAGETEAWDQLPLPRLPKWLRRPLVDAYGKSVVTAIEAAHAAGAPVDLTPRDRDAVTLATAVGGVALPTGSVRLPMRAQVSALPGYAEGRFWVQDAAAAVPVGVLDPRPGERVLDICAAPGGKTMQIAAAGAYVTALDHSKTRMERVRENLARTGLSAQLVIEDARTFAGGPYDAILVDAPCTATGTIRRHPELPHVRDGSDLEALVGLQAAMLDRAAALVRPGGRIVFCTCSLLPEEGEAQASAALELHPELTIDLAALGVTGIDPDWIGPQGLRIRPDYWADRGGMDGFFIVCLRKTAGAGIAP